jgi:FkbM family methyltransferase
MTPIQQWFRDKGDQTHRLQYDLTENSIVFDLGGYRGDWSQSIHDLYNPSIYIFEPIPFLAINIQKRFSENQKIKVYDFGLSSETKELQINFSNDGSSFNTKGIGSNLIDCKVKSIKDFIKENDISEIDLMKINVEGDEFPILNSLIESDLITIIKNVQVQFHSFIPNSSIMRDEIHDNLRKSHDITYNYEFVWENWKRK